MHKTLLVQEPEKKMSLAKVILTVASHPPLTPPGTGP